MPKKLEKKLRATAKKRGYGEERTNRYVFGTLTNLKKKKTKKRKK